MDVRPKRSYFSPRNQIKVFPQQKVEKILFGQSLTIIVDLDLILKIENLPLIFHPGDFAELGIRDYAEDEKTAGIFEICFLSKK